MKIDGIAYRSVWVDQDDGWSVGIIDQTKLPWALEVRRLTSRDEAAHAIRSMQTRGAPLIGAVAAYGLCLGLRADAWSEAMERDAVLRAVTRPAERVAAAYAEAAAIADEDATQNEAIGRHGLPLIEQVARSGRRVNVLTH